MIAFLTALLTLSTFFQFTGGFFFAFVLLNGTLQSTAGAYLQTSVVGVASLFGPQAVQAMMSGQAAVAVVVSGVQVISAAVFLWRESSKVESAELFEIAIASAEERSASTFFALSTVFLILCAVAHSWLVKSPIYNTIAAPLELHKTTRDTNRSLTSTGRTELSDIAHILQVAKANIIYELAIAYVFVVTIVSSLFLARNFTDLLFHVGCIPTDNKFHSADESQYPSSAFHRHPFLGLRYRRSLWSISVLFPPILGLVCESASNPISIADLLCNTLSHMQCSTTVVQHTCAYHYQLRYLIYAHPAHFRSIQWLRDEYVHDVCCLTGTQSQIERSERRC